MVRLSEHAAATSASVEVEVDDGAVLAVVADDGAGGAVATAGGSGLRGLANRLEALGGTLTVGSPPGGGTSIRARVPLGES